MQPAENHNAGACGDAPQSAGRYGGGSGLRRLAVRGGRDHGYGGAGAFPGDRDTELSGRRDHLHAPAGGRSQHRKGVPLRCVFRCRGTDWRRPDDSHGGIHHSAPAVPFKLCGRRHGLCGRGGTDPGDVRRQPLQSRNGSVCGRLYGHDGAGCGAGIKTDESDCRLQLLISHIV